MLLEDFTDVIAMAVALGRAVPPDYWVDELIEERQYAETMASISALGAC